MTYFLLGVWFYVMLHVCIIVYLALHRLHKETEECNSLYEKQKK